MQRTEHDILPTIRKDEVQRAALIRKLKVVNK